MPTIKYNIDRDERVEFIAGSRGQTITTITMDQSHGNVAIYTLYAGDEKIGELIDTHCPCDKCGGRIK